MAANNSIKEGAPYADFAKGLIELRKNAGLTRAQLAEKIGISGRTIINYENGTRIPFADTALKMAQVFGITVEELLGVHSSPAEQEKACAMDSIHEIYDKKAADQLDSLIGNATSLLAGGTLTEEQNMDFILEMQKLLMLATERAKAVYTPKKYRTEDKAEASRERLKQVDAIDQVLRERHEGNHKNTCDNSCDNSCDGTYGDSCDNICDNSCGTSYDNSYGDSYDDSYGSTHEETRNDACDNTSYDDTSYDDSTAV